MVALESVLKLKYKGLVRDKTPSGVDRWRVRVEGSPSKRITLTVPPEHKAFSEHYHAARAGRKLEAPAPAALAPIKNISWLANEHLNFMQEDVSTGHTSPLTLKKRIGLYQLLRNEYGEYALNMPQKAIRDLQRKMRSTPAYADSMVEAIRALYDWAIEQEIVSENPAIGVKKIDKGKGGARPWTMADIKQYVARHPAGTQPYKVLCLFLFTACRIGDAIDLGRKDEFEHEGQLFLGWQPSKKGSAYVKIPLLPQLYEATRAGTVHGNTYLLKQNGQPYASPDALGQHFRGWIKEAELTNLSAHGIRKSVGNILAELGCGQYAIMAIHGHTQSKTSEIYTKGVDRLKLASDAMQQLGQIKL